MRAALIPVKELTQAKMRLADALDRRERAELALAMLTDVITACHDSGRLDAVWVVSGDGEALRNARELKAEPLAEPPELRSVAGTQALNEGLTFGLRQLVQRGVDEVLIFPADIPLVQPDDIRAVADALLSAGARGVVVAPSADGGTNAMALRPPELLAMRFGPDSARAHRDAAVEAGVEPVILDLPRLRFDVDSPDDLLALESSNAGAATSGWLDARAHARARGSGSGR